MKKIMVTGASGGLWTVYSCYAVQDVRSAERHVYRSKVWSSTFNITSAAS